MVHVVEPGGAGTGGVGWVGQGWLMIHRPYGQSSDHSPVGDVVHLHQLFTSGGWGGGVVVVVGIRITRGLGNVR